MVKRLATIMVVVMLMAVNTALAEIDLSGMTYDELVALKDRINLAMWECEEWQEVTVPQGIYEVGVDIPAGHWTLKTPDGVYSMVLYGRDTDGNQITHTEMMWELRSPSHKYYEEGQSQISAEVTFAEKMYVQVAGGECIFAQYTGKPDLGFK